MLAEDTTTAAIEQDRISDVALIDLLTEAVEIMSARAHDHRLGVKRHYYLSARDFAAHAISTVLTINTQYDEKDTGYITPC